MHNTKTYLTTEELSERIKYNPRYVREHLKDSVFLEGIHYIRPFGLRKVLFIWEVIEQEMLSATNSTDVLTIPLHSGGVIHG